MTIDFRRAMREATALTRSQNLSGATKAIQAALSSLSAPVPIDYGRASQGDRSEEAPKIPGRTFKARITGRLRLPLGEAISALRKSSPTTEWLRNTGRPTGVAEVPDGAQFLMQVFNGPSGTREFKLYIPSSKGPRPALLLMLHGCNQEADDFAAGTRMNVLAEEFGFLVAYPIQPRSQNPSGCWNWFRPTDQRRESGEPAIIAGIADQIARQYDTNSDRVFVAGLSAGGAMTAVMGATYPDLFAGIGIHSGLPYGAANDVMSAFAAMRGDINMPRVEAASLVPTIIFHGDADQTVDPLNADRIVDAMVACRDATGTSIGEASGRRYTKRVSSEGASVSFEMWTVHGAGHAWSGGSTDGTYADTAGPDASREMVRFFKLSEGAGEDSVS